MSWSSHQAVMVMLCRKSQTCGVCLTIEKNQFIFSEFTIWAVREEFDCPLPKQLFRLLWRNCQ